MENRQTNNRPWRLGAVSYLNTKPLLEGLCTTGQIDLALDVPARLPDLLDRGLVDAALVPVIDLHRNEHTWQIVSDACIGCDGPALTVRVFSRVRPDQITHLHVDGESHTSVVLARVIWQERYGRRLQVSRFEPGKLDDLAAVLLIGDKVVTQGLADFGHQVDLGEAWQDLTGLPFVFAVWAARRDTKAARLAALLEAARDRGVAVAADIARRHASALGWPADLAVRYLTDNLCYTLTPGHGHGMQRFFEMADRWGVGAASPELSVV